MSDSIKHECGIAFIRLLKPADYYLKKYGTSFYGLNKMHILMEKQHNRGQDGAGVANIKLYPEPGCVYINRVRSNGAAPIKDIFQQIDVRINEAVAKNPQVLQDPLLLKKQVEFTGEIFLGHLRYGTFGKNDIENVHPVSRENNWMTRSLVLAGNFNLTNIDELFDRLIELGQYPPAKTDTVTILERIGHFLDRENDDKYRYFKDKGYSKHDVTEMLAKHIDLKEVLSLSARRWDGGYAMAGVIGHGDAFIMRDPVRNPSGVLLLRRRSRRRRFGARGDPDDVQPRVRRYPGADAGPRFDRATRRRCIGRSVYRAAADPALFVRADLFLAGQRPRYLPRAQAARTAACAADFEKY